ncbi:MAG: hypothetical protein LBI34_01950 [Puniceicoccales bacterium]|jgi:hypothetical protein|nr:hypothetical protein [Puniceicoccales bacterium]
MFLQAISPSDTPQSIPETKTFCQLMACRTQISFFAIFADITIFLSAVLIIPYLFYILYCLFIDCLHHQPVIFLWRNMRRELAANQPLPVSTVNFDTTIEASGDDDEKSVAAEISEQPTPEQETLSTKDAQKTPKANPPDLAPPSDESTPDESLQRLRNELKATREDRLDAATNKQTVGRCTVWWPAAPVPPDLSPNPNISPNAILNRVSGFYERHYLTPEREESKKRKLEEIEDYRRQLEEFASTMKEPEITAGSKSVTFGPTARPRNPEIASTPPAADSGYRDADGRKVSFPGSLKEIYVSPSENQCAYRALAVHFKGDENKFQELKEEIYNFALLFLGVDPKKFDYDNFRKRLDAADDLFAGKSGAQEKCTKVFGDNEVRYLAYLLPMVKCLFAIEKQRKRMGDREEMLEANKEHFENGAYIRLVGRSNRIDEILRKLINAQDELAAFDVSMSGMSYLGELCDLQEQIGYMIDRNVFSADSIFQIPKNIVFGGIASVPDSLFLFLGPYTRSIIQTAYNLWKDKAGNVGMSPYLICACLYKCKIRYWDYESRKLTTYGPEGFEIPTDHPYGEKLLEMCRVHGRDIDILSKPVCGNMQHCYALVPQE